MCGKKRHTKAGIRSKMSELICGRIAAGENYNLTRDNIAILTALKRLEAACGDDDIVFRIGGDEFVALTNSENKDYTDKIVNEILSHNGEPFNYQEKEIPLTLYVTSYKIEEKTLRYSELFTTMQRKLDCIK